MVSVRMEKTAGPVLRIVMVDCQEIKIKGTAALEDLLGLAAIPDVPAMATHAQLQLKLNLAAEMEPAREPRTF